MERAEVDQLAECWQAAFEVAEAALLAEVAGEVEVGEEEEEEQRQSHLLSAPLMLPSLR